MASSVKIVMKPHQINPGKERQVEHARRLVQQGLNRGMRLQETKIVPLAPDDQVSQEIQEPEPEPQKPPQKAPKPQKKITETQAVKESPLTTKILPLPPATGTQENHQDLPMRVSAGDQYKHNENDKVVAMIGIFGPIVLIADINLLKKGSTQVMAMDYEIFKKKFEKV